MDTLRISKSVSRKFRNFLRTLPFYKSLHELPVFLPLLLGTSIFFLFAQYNIGNLTPERIQQLKVHVLNNNYNTSSDLIDCSNPRIIDGDTFNCGGTRIRLAGIDTPEMPGHCRPGRECTPGNPYDARDYLVSISRGAVACTPIEKDRYGRTVARCESDNGDLSCAMLHADYAVMRYGGVSC